MDHVEVAGRQTITIPSVRSAGSGGGNGNASRKLTVGVIDTFAYEIAESEGETVEVSTTRLETMLGDVGIAIHSAHPLAERAASTAGVHAIHPVNGRHLPVRCEFRYNELITYFTHINFDYHAYNPFWFHYVDHRRRYDCGP